MPCFEQFALRQIVKFDQFFLRFYFSFVFEISGEQIIFTVVREQQTHRIIVFAARFVFVIIVIQKSHSRVFGKVVYALCSVLLLVTIQRGIMNRSRLHFGFAFGNVTRIKRACRIGTRKIYYGFTFVFAEQTPIVFRSGKPCNMVFVSVRCDNVFQNIIRHEFIKIGFDCGNAVCLAAGVDQNIVFSRADVNTVTRIFVAELEKMHRKFPVRNNSDCIFVKNGRRSIPASPVSFSRTVARVIGVRPKIQYVIYRLHRSHSACKPAPGKRGSDCYYNHRHNDYYRRSGQFYRLFFV